MIVIGSLAAGYHYFHNERAIAVRTKDADCLLTPRISAVPAGIAITERLLGDGWIPRPDDRWGQPGTADTPLEELPAVRLQPPGDGLWFLELLGAPSSGAATGPEWLRLPTQFGHYGLCCFPYFGIVSHQPRATPAGIRVARPEMMVLAHLLEHPEITGETMSRGFAGRSDIRRCNKDLGRVLAIAWLAEGQDGGALLEWPEDWEAVLRATFPERWADVAARAGTGLRALLASEEDLEQAWHTCIYGLLASKRPSGSEALRASGERLLVDAVEPLERQGRAALFGHDPLV
jgi:hypothetical protein